MKNDWGKAEEVLEKGGVIVLPTDTLYGIIAKATKKDAVERIYDIKGRNTAKPFIVLINSYKQFSDLEIILNDKQKEFLKKVWPGEVSVILPCLFKKFEYLHRGEYSIAFRMIGKRNRNLYKLINSVGPVIAPSVNPEGQDPALSIRQAKKYFGNKIDLYINAGTKISEPSTLVKEKSNGSWEILRQGKVKIK